MRLEAFLALASLFQLKTRIVSMSWDRGVSCRGQLLWKEFLSLGLRFLVDPEGLEPSTSSMPWKRASQLRHGPLECGLCRTCRTKSLLSLRRSELLAHMGLRVDGAGLEPAAFRTSSERSGQLS
jgi:hypothetical protein